MLIEVEVKRDGVTEEEKPDEPESFEEHFLAAYLAAVEKCDIIRHEVPHMERKHAPLAAVGYSTRSRKYVGCDVLDWFDRWWPSEMNPSKVLPKLRERVELFSRRVSLEEIGRRAKSPPKQRFVFFGFGPLSRRLLAALPGIETAMEVQVVREERLREVARSVGTFSLSTEAPQDNHFVRAVRLLSESGWGPGITSSTQSKGRRPIQGDP